jgi:glycosyltransferase involved in cell wall biosynthesis
MNRKKKILIDLSKLKGDYCGLREVTRQFGEALIRQIDFDKWDVTYLVPTNHPFTDARVHYKPMHWCDRFLSRFWQYDVVHSLVQNSPYLRRKNKRTKYVVTLHDLNFLYEKKSRKKEKYRNKYQQNAKGIHHFAFISHFVEQDVLTHLKLDKATTYSVIYNGIAERKTIDTCPPKDFLNKLSSREYLFIVSTFMRKKNIHLLVDMMRFLPNLCLAVAGQIIHYDYYGEVLQTIKKNRLQDRIIMLGTVDEQEKCWLYDHCKAFVFPSLAEGFGIPPIEAMRAGKPAFVARKTSIPEICGDMAFYWDTLAGEAMAQTLIKGLADTNAPQNNAELLEVYASRYNWDRCASEYINIYKTLI